MSVVAFASAFAPVDVFAVVGDAPQSFTLDGQLLVKGTTNPLLDAAAKLTIQILDPSKTCVLYEEEQTVATLATNGYFNVQIGSPIGGGFRTVHDLHHSMKQVFQNRAAMTGISASATEVCAGGIYSPTAAGGDGRQMRIYVTPSQTNVADLLLPEIGLDSVPNAMVADSIQGFGPSDLLLVNSTANLTQTNLETLVTGTGFTDLQALLGGTSPKYAKAGANGTAALPGFPTASPPTSTAAGQIWYDTTSGQVKYQNSGGVQTLGTSGGSVTSVGLSLPSGLFNVTTPTVTSSGTLTASYNSQTQNTFFAAPSSGGAGGPAFRAIASADLPTVGVAQGGTGATSLTGYGLLAMNSGGTAVTSTVCGSGMTLISNGTSYSCQAAGGTGTVTSIVAGSGLSGGTITGSGTIALNSIAANTLLANATGSSAVPTATSISGVIDAAISSTQGSILYRSGTGWAALAPGSSGNVLQSGGPSANPSWTAAAAGSVTNVGLSLPSGLFNVTTPTVTSSGTLTAGYNSQTQNTFFAAPSGSAGAPVFRAIASADLPTVGVAQGGTGATSFANYSAIASNGSGNQVAVAGSTSNTMLQWTVTGPAWSSASYPATTTANQLLYSSAANVVGGITTVNNAVLTTNGSGVPSWTTIATDSFTQYALLAGRSGGQTVKGGTAASENLTLDSTAHATKGFVFLNPSGGNVGVGTTSPLSQLQVGSAPLSGYNTPVSGAFYSASDAWNVLTISRGGIANPQSLFLGVNQAATYSEIQALQEGVAKNALLLNRQGGNVGIGTTSPSYTLDVTGSERVTGGLTVGGVALLAAASGSNGNSVTIDFSTGNLQYSTATSCTGLTITGVKEGGSYMVAMQSLSGSPTCTFSTSWTLNGTVITNHIHTPASITAGSTQTVFNLVVVYGELYVTYVPYAN